MPSLCDAGGKLLEADINWIPESDVLNSLNSIDVFSEQLQKMKFKQTLYVYVLIYVSMFCFYLFIPSKTLIRLVMYKCIA